MREPIPRRESLLKQNKEYEDKIAKCAVRISLDESNTMAEVEQFLIVFRQLYQKFTKVM